jgi:hypothetical protein
VENTEITDLCYLEPRRTQDLDTMLAGRRGLLGHIALFCLILDIVLSLYCHPTSVYVLLHFGH